MGPESSYVLLIDSDGLEVEWFNEAKCGRYMLGEIGDTIVLTANRYGYPDFQYHYWPTLRNVRMAN